MNTPTKITFSRIIAIGLMITGMIVLEIMSAACPQALIPLYYSFGLERVEINIVYLVLCVFFILAAITDALDGYLARKNNQVTDLGKFLDPVADKLLVNSLLIFLCVEHTAYSHSQLVIPYIFVLLMIARDIVVDALRFIAAKKNVVIAANIFGKAKTVAQMITIPIVLLNGWPFTYFDASWNPHLRIASFFVYITTALSLISGIIYVVQNKDVLKDGSKKTRRTSK